jgi:6-phosphogluconolactonase (cycloisomerase 2 family)
VLADSPDAVRAISLCRQSGAEQQQHRGVRDRSRDRAAHDDRAVSTEAVPSAFCLDPAGRFLFTAGTASGRLASYRVNDNTGALSPLAVIAVGQRPAAVLATRLG